MYKTSEFESILSNRRKRILRAIRGDIAIFPAAPASVSSRDVEHPYRQNSDFLYLTNFEEPDSILVLLGKTRGPRSILYLRDRDAASERWVGSRLGLKRAKRRFKVDEIRNIENFERDFPKLIRNCRTLHYALGAHPRVDDLVWQIFRTPVGPHPDIPDTIRDSRVVTSEMRVIKDKQEIRILRHAVDITAQGFTQLAANLREVVSEAHGASLIESHFRKFGADGTAFSTIVASGKNATVLHHTPKLQPLWKRELVLIDAGASYRGYAGDISRTLPASGKFSIAQGEVYDVVLLALENAIKRSRPGATLEQVHMAAVRTICRGLINLGICEGSVSELVESKEYRKYFMHRTGHWLGLDVHDISPVYQDEHFIKPHNRTLEAGNAFTIEPGLYFDSQDQDIPKEYRGIGIRIEEDVLITPRGCEVLSRRMPTARDEIEALMNTVVPLVPRRSRR